MHMQDRSCMQRSREHMCKRSDARQLRARRSGMLLPVLGDDLRQRGVYRRGWRGFVLHQRMHGRGDRLSVGHEPSDMRRRGQRMHRLHHLDLHQRSVQRHGWRGFLLHERLFSWSVWDRRDTVSVGHEPQDMFRRGQRLHGLHHLDLLHRAGLRAPLPRSVRGSKLGRVADAQWSGRRDRRGAES